MEEKKDEEMEDKTESEENVEIKEKKMVQVVVEKEESVEKDEAKKNERKKNDMEKNEVEKNEVEKNEAEKIEVEKNEVESNEAETAMTSLKALRKSVLLDVLSKIVSVAKSKDVNPAMFTLTNGENQAGKDANPVDLTKIKD